MVANKFADFKLFHLINLKTVCEINRLYLLTAHKMSLSFMAMSLVDTIQGPPLG